MQMTEAFASAVVVSVPIFALAAGAEARTIRERLQRPDPRWERQFADYSAQNDLDMSGRPADVFAYFRGVPGLSRLYLVERAIAIAAAVVWVVVFVLLTIAELRCLVWLADGDPPGQSGLADFAVVAIGIAMATLIMAPTLYLLVPLVAPLDFIPEGLKKAVGPALGDKQGRGFLRQVVQELEGAMERAGANLEQGSRGDASSVTSAPAADGAPEPAGDTAVS